MWRSGLIEILSSDQGLRLVGVVVWFVPKDVDVGELVDCKM